MSFAAEIRDFAAGFQATAQIGDRIATRRMKRDATKIPGDDDLGAIPDPFGGSTPQASSGRTNAAGATASVDNRGGGPFLDQAYNYYRKRGLGHAQAAGIAGNLNLESAGGDPRVLAGVRRGDNGTAAYAAQWRDKRLKNLIAFSGGGQPTLKQQFDFVLEESNPESPYADQQWAAAMPRFMAAKTPEEATGLFMNAFERPSADPKINGIAKRTAWAGSLQDSGSGGATSFSWAASDPGDPSQDTSYDDDGQDPGDDGQDPGQDPGDGQEPADDGSYSPEAGITIVPTEEVAMAVPQVQSPWAQQLPPGADMLDMNAARSTLFAQRGGKIPSRRAAPVQRYAPGGPVDPYNPGRDLTVIAPGAPANTFVPRRVGMPNPTATPSGSTPSQIAFRRRPVAPVVAPVVAPPKAVEPPKRYTINWAPQPNSGDRAGTGHQFLPFGDRPITFSNMSELDPRIRKYVEAHPTRATISTLDPAYRAGGPPLSPFRGVPGFTPGYEEGGVIPEVSFAGGGKVDRDARFDELFREESRGSGAGGISGSARDRAAKRLSREEGRATSSAYSAADDTKYWKRTSPKPAQATAPAPVQRPAPMMLEDRATRDRSGAPQPLTEDRATRDRSGAPPIANPIAAEMQDRAPRTVMPYADTLDLGPQVQSVGAVQGRPVPVASGGGVTRPEAPLPFGERGAAADASFEARREELQQTFPNNPIVGAHLASNPVAAEMRDRAPPMQMVIDPQTRQPVIDPNTREPLMVPTYPAAPTGRNGPYEWQFAQPYRYAEGGAIPDPTDPLSVRQPMSIRARDANYTTSAPGYPSGSSARPQSAPQAGRSLSPAPAEQATADVRPTPTLLSDVGKALDGGVKFLTRHFGLAGDGALPTPEDGANAQGGGVRFASGEGAATPREINAIDDQIDPDRELNEGDRQMTRLAKMTTWYLERGRKKDAEASAASLMQHGAMRFSQLGALAGAAYAQYQRTGSSQDLQHAVKFLQSAYRLVPDGVRFEAQVDPGTRTITATRIGPDGSRENFPVTPEQLPALIGQVRSSSMYWQQIFRLADPAGARAAESRIYDRGKTIEQRAYDERKAARQGEARSRNKLDSEGRSNKEFDRRRAEDRAYREAHPTGGNKTWDTEDYRAAFADASAAKAAYKQANEATGEDDPEVQALREAYNIAASRLYDTIPVDKSALEMERLGFGSFTYQRGSPASSPARPAAAPPAAAAPGQPPAKYPDAKWVNGEWRVVRDGREFRLKPKAS